MSWYYANDGRQTGPVSDPELDALVTSGVVRPETLVWQEGMANWLPLLQASPARAAAAPPPPAAGAANPAPSSGFPGTGFPGPGGGEVTCTECRGTFPKENAIQYGSVWVCAACKPVFVQRLKEGVAPAAGSGAPMQYAGFWIRFAARFIDGLIEAVAIGLPVVAVMFLSGSFNPRTSPGSAQILVQVFAQLASLGFSVAFNTFFIGKFGATPGKMAVGVKVVMADGSPVTYMRAFGRAWADRLSSIICMIGFVMAAFDAERRALHDHICNTRVIYK